MSSLPFCIYTMGESAAINEATYSCCDAFPVPPFTGGVSCAASQTQNIDQIDPETYVDFSGEKMSNYVDIGVGTSLYDGTIGSLWSAATGTVSVDHKLILIKAEMIQLMRASGYNTTWNAVYNQSLQDVTGVLKQAKADPSDASFGNNPGLANLKKWLEIGAAVVAVYIVIELLIDFEVFKSSN